MAPTGKDALDRSQASAEAETGSIVEPVRECTAWIGVAANYDDPWATPITGCQVRIKVNGEVVADGPRTKGLSAYGKQDGQSHGDVRSALGVYRQTGVKAGSAVIALAPEGGDDPKAIEQQILGYLSALETSMRQRLQPWITEWARDGWWSIPEARRRGFVRGVGAWWENELEFWASVGDTAKEVWSDIRSGMSKVATWYEDLPWYEKLAPTYALERELVEWLAEGAQTLWKRREQLMNLLKAFFDGTAAAIEKALEALIDLPGKLGQLFRDIVQHSTEWVQNMIEVARNTDVFKRATKTIMTIVMMMTPNFWAEGRGLVEGYLLPEVLITIALILIGELCAAASASALAERIAGFLSRLRKAINAAGKIGEALTALFRKLEEVAELIGKLSKALRRRIEELAEGVTDKLNKVIRRTTKSTIKVNEGKWDYFFGRVKSSPHNEARSLQNARDLEKLGIKEAEGGRERLMKIFEEGMKAPDKATHVTEYGTTITRTVEIPGKGAIDIKYFYPQGNLSSTPEISTIIPKLFK